MPTIRARHRRRKHYFALIKGLRRFRGRRRLLRSNNPSWGLCAFPNPQTQRILRGTLVLSVEPTPLRRLGHSARRQAIIQAVRLRSLGFMVEVCLMLSNGNGLLGDSNVLSIRTLPVCPQVARSHWMGHPAFLQLYRRFWLHHLFVSSGVRDQ